MSSPAPLASQTLTAGPEAAGARLDAFLALAIPDCSRATLQRWIRDGHVLVDGRPAGPPARKLRGGERIEVTPPPPRPSALAPAPIALEVLHRDEDLLVIVKPAGMVVHPGAGTRGPTLVNALLALDVGLSGIGGEQRPGIVHRLDRDTSGLLVVACNDRAHRELSRSFQERRVEKEYRAVCWGRPTPSRGTVDLPIGRDPVRRRTMSPRGRRLRDARTHYRVGEILGGFTWLELRIETGRTHQIRAHLKALGHPVVGDREYGGAGWRRVRDPAIRDAIRGFDRLALHAFRLAFDHPVSGERLDLTAPIPAAMTALVQVLREGGA